MSFTAQRRNLVEHSSKLISNFLYYIKMLGITSPVPFYHRTFSKRKYLELCSFRRFLKFILIAFIFVQVVFFFSSTSNKNKHEKDINKAVLFEKNQVNHLPKDILEKNNQSPGERRIKSFKESSEHYDGAKKESYKEIEKNRGSHSEQSSFEAHAPAHLRFQSRRGGEVGNSSTIPLCPRKPPNLLGRLEFRFNATPPTLQDVAYNNPKLTHGGFYHPLDCTSRSKIAIIIPHRARELHLRALLWHLHPILQRQQLYYKIYVVHQAGNLAFNKAKLMNIGFLEALKEDEYDCVVFHDVDLLPEDDRLLYTCKDTPKHLSVAIDKYGYRLPYTALFGGVTMLSMDQFRDVNGYSNMYWGWGGEDDDMFNRIFSRGYTIKRPPFYLARYKMSFHQRDKGNRLNLMRYEILSRSVNRIQEDGLNNVKYRVVSVNKTPVFTNITADVGTAVIQCKPFLSQWTCGFVMWMCEHLTLSCGMLQYNSTDDGTLALPLNTRL